MWYSQKLVISGDFIEHYQYERAIEEGYERGDEFKKKGRESSASELERFENRKKVLQRARTRIRRVINSNVSRWNDERGSPIEPKFFTMTYAENITDIKYSNNEFEKFIKRLKRALKKPIKYLAVIEFQKRGAIHYHVIFFNLKYVKKEFLSKLWGNGFVKINRINNVDNVGAYVSKYLGKDLYDERLVGEKCYFTSRDLIKPVEIKDSEKVEMVLGALNEKLKIHDACFANEYVGEIKYSQYLTDETALEKRIHKNRAKDRLEEGLNNERKGARRILRHA